MIDIMDAIKKINPNAQVVIRGTELDLCILEWVNGTTEISKADIEAKMTELQTAYDNNEYQRNRASQYPELKEQLDMQYKDLLNGTTTWKDAVAKVKSDNPKS